MNSFQRDVKLGIYLGVVVGTFFALLLLLARVMGGDGSGLPSGLTYPEAIGVYLVGGFVGGVIFGSLLPLAKTIVGSMFLGMLVAGPGVFGFAYLSDMSYLDAFLIMTLVGIVGGYFAWSRYIGPSGGEGSSAE